jgi:hypothetical protein
MSADGGHLGWRSGSLDIILKVDHLRTIHAIFAILVAFKYFVQSDWLIIVQNLELPYNAKLKTQVVSSNPAHGEVYSLEHYVIKFVSDLRQISGFL